jgi:NTP pyrophosphatase (non-canonical NTP hydrolase)
MPEAAPTLEALTERLIAFRDARDWRRFHSLKDLIVSLNLEAAEALELTQWQGEASIEEAAQDPGFRARLAEECADVIIYLLLIAERAGFDLRSATAAKIDKNEAKYPVEKSRGNARKYTEL